MQNLSSRYTLKIHTKHQLLICQIKNNTTNLNKGTNLYYNVKIAVHMRFQKFHFGNAISNILALKNILVSAKVLRFNLNSSPR